MIKAKLLRQYKRDANGKFATTNAQKVAKFKKEGGFKSLKARANALRATLSSGGKKIVAPSKDAKTGATKPGNASSLKAISEKRGKATSTLSKLKIDNLTPHAIKEKKRLGDAGWKKVREADKVAIAKLKEMGYSASYGYTNLKINPDPKRPHVVANYKDSKGNTKDIHTTEYRKQQDNNKFARGKEFTSLYPKMISQIKKDAEHSEEAKALYVIAKTGLRIGSKSETHAKVKAYGISTLKAEHVKVEGNKVTLDFIGKKGVRQQHSYTDPVMAAIFARGGSQAFNTSDTKIRDYMKKIDKAHRATPGTTRDNTFQPKDFRTHAANATALGVLKKLVPPKTESDYNLGVFKASEAASKRLGNDRSMTLKAYIDPKLFEVWKGGW